MSQDPIIDYWGTGISVDLVYKSAGAFVYLELDGEETEDFARLTPEQAVQLADRLKAAAEQVGGLSG